MVMGNNKVRGYLISRMYTNRKNLLLAKYLVYMFYSIELY